MCIRVQTSVKGGYVFHCVFVTPRGPSGQFSGEAVECGEVRETLFPLCEVSHSSHQTFCYSAIVQIPRKANNDIFIVNEYRNPRCACVLRVNNLYSL